MRQIPAAILKASYDTCFEYAVKLKNGDFITFEGCNLYGESFEQSRIDQDGNLKETKKIRDQFNGWILLTDIIFNRSKFCDFTLVCERGIEIHVDDIVWACDAPRGS